MGEGFFHESASGVAFPDSSLITSVLGYLNSSVARHFLRSLNPTVTFQSGDISRIPWKSVGTPSCVDRLVCTSQTDWNAYERSWDFQSLPILTASSEPTPTLESSYTTWVTQNSDTIAEMKRLEEENNRLFIDATAWRTSSPRTCP